MGRVHYAADEHAQQTLLHPHGSYTVGGDAAGRAAQADRLDGQRATRRSSATLPAQVALAQSLTDDMSLPALSHLHLGALGFANQGRGALAEGRCESRLARCVLVAASDAQP